MKILSVCFLISFLIAVSLLNKSDARNSTWGYIRPGDYLLHREFVVKSSSWMQVTTKDVNYPPKGYVNNAFISAVLAIDRKRKDGGYAILTRGGPGYKNVTLHVKSDRNHGLNYTIEIYGR